MVRMNTWLNPKYSVTSPRIAANSLYKRNVQRSSPDGRVEPQANGGRKIPFYNI